MAYSRYDHSVLERAEAESVATALVDSMQKEMGSSTLRRFARSLFPLRAAVLTSAIEILGAPNSDTVHRGEYTRRTWRDWDDQHLQATGSRQRSGNLRLRLHSAAWRRSSGGESR